MTHIIRKHETTIRLNKKQNGIIVEEYTGSGFKNFEVIHPKNITLETFKEMTRRLISKTSWKMPWGDPDWEENMKEFYKQKVIEETKDLCNSIHFDEDLTRKCFEEKESTKEKIEKALEEQVKKNKNTTEQEKK